MSRQHTHTPKHAVYAHARTVSHSSHSSRLPNRSDTPALRTSRPHHRRSRLTILQLDEDVILHILSYLHVRDILSLRMTSTQFAALTRLSSVWHAALTRHVLALDIPVPSRCPRPASDTQSDLEAATLSALSLHRRWTAPRAVPRNEKSWETGVGKVRTVKFVDVIGARGDDGRGDARKQMSRQTPADENPGPIDRRTGTATRDQHSREQTGSRSASRPIRGRNACNAWGKDRYLLSMGSALAGLVTVQVWDLQPRPGATPGRRPMHPSCSSSSEDDDEGQADADCVANLNFNGKTTGFVVDESDGKGERATFAITVSQRARAQQQQQPPPPQTVLNVYSLVPATPSPRCSSEVTLTPSFSLSLSRHARVLALHGRLVVLERERAPVHANEGANGRVGHGGSRIVVMDWTSTQACEVTLTPRSSSDSVRLPSEVLAVQIINDWVLVFRATSIEMYSLSPWIEAMKALHAINAPPASPEATSNGRSGRQRNSTVLGPAQTLAGHGTARNRASTLYGTSSYAPPRSEFAAAPHMSIPTSLHPTSYHPFTSVVHSIMVTERVSFATERSSRRCQGCRSTGTIDSGASSSYHSKNDISSRGVAMPASPPFVSRHGAPVPRQLRTVNDYSPRSGTPTQAHSHSGHSQSSPETSSALSPFPNTSYKACNCTFRPLSLAVRYRSSGAHEGHDPHSTPRILPRNEVEHYVLHVNESYYPHGRTPGIPYVLPPVHTHTIALSSRVGDLRAIGKHGTLVGLEDLDSLQRGEDNGFPQRSTLMQSERNAGGWSLGGLLRGVAGGARPVAPQHSALAPMQVGVVGRTLKIRRLDSRHRKTGEEAFSSPTRASAPESGITHFQSPRHSVTSFDACNITAIGLDEQAGRVFLGDRDGWVHVWSYL